MRAGPVFLKFDWSKASLSMDLPVFVYSHMKTGFKFFQDREDIGQARIQTGLSGLYRPVRFFRDGSTLNNSHNIFILNLNQFYCLSFFQ